MGAEHHDGIFRGSGDLQEPSDLVGLEAAGYAVTRAAGSKGPANLIAWTAEAIRFISVKSGTKYLSAVERAAFQNLAVPPNAARECWRFPDRCRAPLIERL